MKYQYKVVSIVPVNRRRQFRLRKIRSMHGLRKHLPTRVFLIKVKVGNGRWKIHPWCWPQLTRKMANKELIYMREKDKNSPPLWFDFNQTIPNYRDHENIEIRHRVKTFKLVDLFGMRHYAPDTQHLWLATKNKRVLRRNYYKKRAINAERRRRNA